MACHGVGIGCVSVSGLHVSAADDGVRALFRVVGD